MTGTVLYFPESIIESLVEGGDATVRARFGPARLVKSQGIPLADASTLWAQHGTLVVHEAEIEGALPETPATVASGSLEVGGQKYIDMGPVPMDTHGYLEVRLVFAAGGEVTVTGSGGRLEMEGTPRYLRHLEESG